MFETGTNHWRKYDAWPPKAATAPGRSTSTPAASWRLEPPGGRPTTASTSTSATRPSRCRIIDKIGIGMAREYMTADQRFAARRPDVLVYETAVLDEDVTIAGPIEVDLHVSTTGTDSDWVVKLIDVYPDDYPDPNPNPTGVKMGGYQQLVRGDVMRGKFRNSFEKPEPFAPGKPTRVKFTLPDVCHTFRPGHRIMVQVQSSWFPLVDRNPQTFVDIYTAKESDFRKATQRVYRSKAHPSRVEVVSRLPTRKRLGMRAPAESSAEPRGMSPIAPLVLLVSGIAAAPIAAGPAGVITAALVAAAPVAAGSARIVAAAPVAAGPAGIVGSRPQSPPLLASAAASVGCVRPIAAG